MRRLNFTKLGVFLILGAIACVADKQHRITARDEERIIGELRILNDQYLNTYSAEERNKISRRALDLIDGNLDIRLPRDLNVFVATTLTAPIE